MGLEKRSRIEAGSVGQLLSDAYAGDILDDIAPASSPLPRDAAKDAISTVLDEMKSVCMVYYVDSLKVLVAHANVVGDSTERKVDIILADTPYNIRNELSMNNSFA